jgi:hypothetical protein
LTSEEIKEILKPFRKRKRDHIPGTGIRFMPISIAISRRYILMPTKIFQEITYSL